MQVNRECVLAWHQSNEPAFADSIAAKVRQRHPTYRQTDAMLRQSVGVGIRRARRNGFSSDHIISEFVLIMFEVAPNFDHQKDIRRMLDTYSIPAQPRWERLFTPEFDPAWDEADSPEFLDANAWFDHPTKEISEAPMPTETEWAEVVAAYRIQNTTLPGNPVRSATLAELASALQDIRGNSSMNLR